MRSGDRDLAFEVIILRFFVWASFLAAGTFGAGIGFWLDHSFGLIMDEIGVIPSAFLAIFLWFPINIIEMKSFWLRFRLSKKKRYDRFDMAPISTGIMCGLVVMQYAVSS